MTDNVHYVCAEGQWAASYHYQHWTNWDLFINYSARIVRVECNGAKTGSGSWDSINAPFKIPNECVPKRKLNASVVVQNGGSTTKMLSVNENGTVSLSNQGGSGSANSCLDGITYIYQSILSCFQLDSTGLHVRPFADITYNVGSWSSAAFPYTIR